jgi:hypothetical protein
MVAKWLYSQKGERALLFQDSYKHLKDLLWLDYLQLELTLESIPIQGQGSGIY